MLWKIAGSPLHILGAIHLSDAPLKIDGESLHALDGAKTIAFESNWDAPQDFSAARFPAGQRLSQLIPGQLFEDTLALWSRLELPDELEEQRPWRVVAALMGSLIPELGFDYGYGIDRMVRARSTGRALFSLEAANVPFRYMAAAPLSEQISGMAKVVQQPLVVKGELQSIVDGWRDRDLRKLSDAAERGHRESPVLNAGLIGARNRAWMPHLLRFARSSKPTVAVVGILHMVGTDALVDLFKAAGFSCELVQG